MVTELNALQPGLAIDQKLKDLEQQVEQLRREKEKLEAEKQSNEAFRKETTWWVGKVVSALAILYLIWGVIAPNNMRPKEITNQDVAIAFVVLLFNSGLLDKLTGLSITGNGVEAKFKELEKEIDQNKQNIYELQQKQIDDLLNLQCLLYRAVLDGYEYLTLYRLNQEDGGRLPDYHYSILGESQLRRLYSIGFIKLKPGHSFQELRTNEHISFQVLKDCFTLTDYGKQYLSQMDRMELEPRIAD